MNAALTTRFAHPQSRGRPRANHALTPALSAAQITSLGVLLIAAQLPLAVHLPLWAAGLGLALVALRCLLLRRDRLRPQATPARIPSWALAVFALLLALAVRKSYGYLIGRDPCVAFLFILVGIKFLEARRLRDGSLLVCLAAFLLVTPFFYDQSIAAALAAIPAVLAVGAALQSLAISDSADSTTAALGWRVAWARTAVLIAQGLPIAATLFLLFPRLAGPLWGLPADRAATTGLSDRMAPGTISAVALSDAVAFRVDFDGPVPPRPLRYWRGPVLTLFNGREWRALPPRAGGQLATGGVRLRYTVTLEPDDHRWLFALDVPSALPELAADPSMRSNAGGLAGLSSDQQLVTRLPVMQPLRYTQQSILRDRYPVASRSELALDSRLPPGNPLSVAFAQELRRSYPDEGAYIAAVLAWFHHEPFRYTLSPPLLEDHPVDAFLFDTRRGFCEHFASAFVVLLRAAGIPSRVVTGYQGGEINPRGGYMIVRQSDAHAWAEAVVDGQWRRFDPTAAVAPSRIDRGLFASVPASDPVPLFARGDSGLLQGLDLAIDAINYQWRRNVIEFNHDRQRSLWRDWGIGGYAPWQIVAIAVAAILAWAAVVFAWFAARRERSERAVRLWRSLCRRLARAGLPRPAWEGPIAYAERAAKRWPNFRIAFGAIGDSFAMLRYGPVLAQEAQRFALIATLERAIDVLPSPAELRTMKP